MDNTIVKSIISYLIIVSIFIMGKPLLEMGFFLYWYHILYIFFALYSIFVFRSIGRNVFWVIVALIICSVLTFKYSLPLVLKQLINLTFALFVFDSFIRHERFDFFEIFRKYVVCCKVVLLIGFLQVLLYRLGLESIYLSLFPFLRETNISVRMQSVMLEPSFIAYAFVPVIFLSLYNLFHNQVLFISKKWSLLFLFGYGLTFSLSAYFGVLLILLILYFQNFTLQKLAFVFAFLLTLVLLAYVAYQNVEDVKLRVDDTYFGITNGIIKNEGYTKVNLSTYALLSNAYVTKRSLQDHPFTGAGLGSYPLIYDKYIPVDLKLYYEISSEEGNSLGLRLLAETGVVGFFAFCFFVLKFRIKGKVSFSPDQKFFWLLNSSIFVLAILLLIRSGDYTATGRILFFLIYYYTYCEMTYKEKAQVLPA